MSAERSHPLLSILSQKMKSISNLTRYLIIPAVAGLLAACATAPNVSVTTDYDHAAAFGNYHTYALDAAAARLNPSNTAVLENSLRSSLAARGLKESTGQGDLYIVPTVRTKEKVDIIPSGNVAFYPSAFGRYGYWPGVTLPADVEQYTEGTLVLDFVDRKTHKLVFRGVGKGVLGSAEKNAAGIEQAVNKIVGDFPAAR